MQLVMTDNSGPPPGLYTAAFAEFKQTTSEQYGAGLCLTFTVDSGEHSGVKVGRTGKPTPTPQNVMGKLLAGLLGRQMKPGEAINLSDFVGKRYTIVVAQSPSGKSTRVESILPLA